MTEHLKGALEPCHIIKGKYIPLCYVLLVYCEFSLPSWSCLDVLLEHQRFRKCWLILLYMRPTRLISFGLFLGWERGWEWRQTNCRAVCSRAKTSEVNKSNGCVFRLASYRRDLDWVLMTLFAWARFPRGIDQLSYEFLKNVTLPFRYYFHRVSLPMGCAFQKVLVSLSSDQRLSAIIESKHTKCVDSSWEGRVHLPNYYKIWSH